MKIRKLLEKTQSLFDADERKSKGQKKHLKHVIKKLRKHQKSLEEQLKKESSKAKVEKLTDQINLAHAQRKKGLKVLKSIKKS